MGEVDPKLMEMADVFHIPLKERLKYIILPAKFGKVSRKTPGQGHGPGPSGSSGSAGSAGSSGAFGASKQS